MVEIDTVIGTVEVVVAVGLVVATVTLDAFRGDPLPWRILAVFAGAEGLGRLRGTLEGFASS